MKSTRLLRVSRILKLLRFINLAGLQHLASALLAALPSLAAAFYICFVAAFAFAVIGVDLFMSKFASCRSDEYPFSSVLNTTQAGKPISDWLDCRATPNASWVTSALHFDNVFNAMEAVSACFLIEGWLSILNNALDADGQARVPRFMANPYGSVFFFVLILFGSFFLMRMFIAVIVLAYADAKRVCLGVR
jgi:hypothetical protein